MGYTRKLAEIFFHYQTLDQLWTSEQIWLKNIMGERNSSHIFFYFKWYKKLIKMGEEIIEFVYFPKDEPNQVCISSTFSVLMYTMCSFLTIMFNVIAN